MASIKKRSDGIYRARYRDEAGKEHARHFQRKTDAQRWLDEVTTSIVTGAYVDPQVGRITFDQWWADYSKRQIWVRGTMDAAEQAAGCVTFGGMPMKSIRSSHVQQWVKAMSQPATSRSKGLAATTIRTRYNFVHMAFRAAVQDRVISTDPSDRIALPRTRRAESAMTIPTPEKVALALGSASEVFQPFVAVCAFAGLRLGEAAGLQLRDVDFLRRTIRVARQIQGQTSTTTEVVGPKQGSERVVYVAQDLIDMLAAHVQRFGVWGEEEWLFGNFGDFWNRNSAGNQWRAIRKAADLEEFTLHDLRHFFASGLIAAGCDVVTVQRALGHSSATITLGTYSHLWPTAEDKTRTAAADLMASVRAADSLRTATA